MLEVLWWRWGQTWRICSGDSYWGSAKVFITNERTYHSEVRLEYAGGMEGEGTGYDRTETEPAQEDIEGKEDKVKEGRENDWDLDTKVAGDDRRAEGNRAEAGVAATVDRDNPIEVAVLEEDHGEGQEGHEDNTSLITECQLSRGKEVKLNRPNSLKRTRLTSGSQIGLYSFRATTPDLIFSALVPGTIDI
jgi:hypothetical protein